MPEPRLLDPEPMPGREIVVGSMHPGTPENWTVHAAQMRDVNGVPHIVLPHWSKPVDS
jgi:hypothetical protein